MQTAARHPVGRDAELKALERARADGVRAVLLEGVAGIGKTTIWRAAAEAARERGETVLLARPTEAEGALAYAALGDLLAPALRGLAVLPPPQRRALEVALLIEEPVGPPPDARAVGTALVSLLGWLAEAGPVVVAVDDVQWLDAETAAVLAFALRRLGELRVSALLALRSGTTAALPLDGARRVEVGPLSVGALHRLLQERLGETFPRPTLLRLHATSGGNPFYALEIARALAAREAPLAPGAELPVPRNLSELARARLDALPEDVQELLEAVAALAEPTLAVLERHGGDRVPERLRRGEAAGVVELDERRVRFTHPLLAAAALEHTGPARLRRLHAALAEAVGEEDARVRHLALAAEGPDAEVAAALDAAAERAAARGAPTAAAELRELAASLTLPDDEEARASRLLEAATQHFRAGASDRAKAILDDLVAALPAGPERSSAYVALGYLVNDYAVAAELCERALADAGDDDAAAARAHRVASEVWQIRGDVDGALAHARAAAERAERAGDEALLARSLGDVAFLETFAGTVTPGLLERAVALEAARDDVPVAYGPQMILGFRLIYADRLDEARRELGQVLARATAAGDETARGSTLAALSDLECRAGRWAEAEAHVDAALEIAEQTGWDQWRAAIVGFKARVLAVRGEVERARALAQLGVELSEGVGDELYRLSNLSVLGFLELSLGNDAAAAELLRPLPALLAEQGYREPGYRPVAADAIEALVGCGELAAARELLASFEAQSEATGTRWGRATSQRCRALVLAAAGDLEGALAAVDEALGRHEAAASPFERARTTLVRGAILRRLRRKREAREALEAARQAFAASGAALWVERAQAELARVGGRSASSGLTPTEAKVAALVAEGRSNKEVAAALFVTVRTVESNLTRIYAKLGVRSRAELAHRLSAAPDA